MVHYPWVARANCYYAEPPDADFNLPHRLRAEPCGWRIRTASASADDEFDPPGEHRHDVDVAHAEEHDLDPVDVPVAGDEVATRLDQARSRQVGSDQLRLQPTRRTD